MIYHYSLHGLTIALPFACPVLIPALPDTSVDLSVQSAVVPRALAHAELQEGPVQLSLRACLIDGGVRAARYLVEDGKTILYQEGAECEVAPFLHYLLFPAMAAALWQRGLVALHGSAVASAAGAILLTGLSGAGKSTTVGALMCKGWSLLSDDLTTMRLRGDGRLEVLPGVAQIHLHEDSAAHIGIDTASLTRHDWHRMKMPVPASHASGTQAAPLHRIIYLHHADEYRVADMNGRDKLPVLVRSLYGPLLPAQFDALSGVFARTLAEVKMTSIGRPAGRWTVDDIVRSIEDRLYVDAPCT